MRPLLNSVLTLALAAASLPGTADPLDLSPFRANATKRWEKEMVKMDAQNTEEKHPAESVLFVGSSSIRVWKDIATDMAPYHPIQRGFGGSRWTDVAVYADRLITPHTFRAVVFFVGNDIRGKEADRTPEEVAGIFRYVRAKVRAHNPSASVFFIAVTPTGSRWQAWPRIKEANTAVRAVCEDNEDTYFIGTESIFLDGDSKPRLELFLPDRLHLNRDGYIRWAAAIKAHLDTVLNGAGS